MAMCKGAQLCGRLMLAVSVRSMPFEEDHRQTVTQSKFDKLYKCINVICVGIWFGHTLRRASLPHRAVVYVHR